MAQATSWRGRRVDETGLIYLGARHYDPVAARFASADPLGHGASMDRYSFANGDPVNQFDPSGRYGAAVADLQLRDNSDIAVQVERPPGSFPQRRKRSFHPALSVNFNLVPKP